MRVLARRCRPHRSPSASETRQTGPRPSAWVVLGGDTLHLVSLRRGIYPVAGGLAMARGVFSILESQLPLRFLQSHRGYPPALAEFSLRRCRTPLANRGLPVRRGAVLAWRAATKRTQPRRSPSMPGWLVYPRPAVPTPARNCYLPSLNWCRLGPRPSQLFLAAVGSRGGEGSVQRLRRRPLNLGGWAVEWRCPPQGACRGRPSAALALPRRHPAQLDPMCSWVLPILGTARQGRTVAHWPRFGRGSHRSF